MKTVLITCAALLISGFLFAQKTTDIPVAKLPKAATDYIKENLPGTTITKATKVEDKGVITYNVSIDVKGRKHILVFDKDGKFLKKGDDLIQSSAPKNKPVSAPPAKTTSDKKAEEKK